jgi:predicted RND superfamily exporter protein
MTDIVERVARALTTHRRVVIGVLLVATILIGAGAPMVEEDSDLEQFESDTEAANASAFISENFVAEGAENQTTVQAIRRGGEGEDVLTRAELVSSLEFQQQLVTDPEIGPTLAEEEPMTGVANIVALYQYGQVFGDLASPEQFDADRLAQLDEDEQLALAGLLGFEGEEAGTILTVFEAFQAQGDGGTGPQDIAAMNATEREAQADQLVDFGIIDEDERGTVLVLFERLAGARPPVDPAAFESPTDQQQALVTDLLGVEQFPPAACFASVEELAGFTETAEQQQPPLGCQQWLLEGMSEDEFEAAIAALLGPEGQSEALALVPQSYEPGSTTANAHSIFITQQTQGGSIESPGGFSDAVVDSQLEMRSLGEEHERPYLVFGLGVLGEEIDQSMSDSLMLVSPIALLFVLLVLTVAYRDLLDILLGLAGVATVLLWTFGFMGWTGIAFNQLMVAVPVLLIGLAIDYAIHVFMRHREQRDGEQGVARSMNVALAGVGIALVWVTATAAIGFLSNLVSPLGPLQDFGVASAFGITAALAVFGALVPAVKVELDRALEARGFDRDRRAFGTGDSRLTSLLEAGSAAARRAPLAVLLLAIVVSAAGAYGATQVDTSFNQEDFLAESPPGWSQELPGPFAPGEYRVTEDLGFIQENFQQVGRQGELLIRPSGPDDSVASDEMLLWLDAATQNATAQETTFILPNGEPDVRSPLSEMRSTAQLAPDSAFAESFTAQEGVPDENVSGLYAEMSAINPDASQLIYAEGGEYTAVRMQVGIDGEAGQQAAAADLETVATHLEEVSNGQLDVVATGDPVTNTEVENSIFETVIESLLITLVAVFVFLAVAYRLTGNPASLGVVTLLPVLFSVTWILGTMWLIGMPFNALTGTIAALTIGLGIAYSIHISARYELELRRQEDVWAALETTVTGTGGALLGSAATTVGGFGTLAVAILPALQQFGIITALTIVYAFLASVLVLPSLLVLWTRYLGPSEHFPGAGTADGETAAGEPATAPDD